MTTTQTPFALALLANIHGRIKRLRADGTVSMSIANLLQVTPTPQSNLQGAPRGTNAAYYYKQLFREVCVSDARIAGFVRECERTSTATPSLTENIDLANKQRACDSLKDHIDQQTNDAVRLRAEIHRLTAQRDSLAKQVADLRASVHWSATVLADGELLPSQRMSAALDCLRAALERSKP